MTKLFWLSCFSLLLTLLSLTLNPVAEAGRVSPVTLLFQGRQALNKNQFDKGLKLLRKAYKELSHWGVVRFELARALHLTGAEPKKVMQHLKYALKKKPTRLYPDVHAFAGVVFESSGDNDQALVHYSQAISLGVMSSRPCLRASRLWLQQEDAARAVTCLQKLLRRGRSAKSVYPLLARAYTGTKQWLKAAQQWKQALSAHGRWLMLWKDAVSFFNRHLTQLPRRKRWYWRRFRNRIRRRLRRMMPRKRPRKLRPLPDSRR